MRSRSLVIEVQLNAGARRTTATIVTPEKMCAGVELRRQPAGGACSCLDCARQHEVEIDAVTAQKAVANIAARDVALGRAEPFPNAAQEQVVL